MNTKTRSTKILSSVSVFICLVASWNAADATSENLRTGSHDPLVGHSGYFDPHNHLNGVLPYWAYGNLKSYRPDDAASVSIENLASLYSALYAWNETEGARLGDQPFSPTGTRYALGARATLALYRPSVVDGNPVLLRGALERVLTATPYTEFDSAYAFRGGPVEKYIADKQGLHGDEFEQKTCEDTILALAYQNITVSEQSMNFIGGFKFKDGSSKRLGTIACYATEPARLRRETDRMNRPVPTVRILLMTSTFELGRNSDGTQFLSIDNRWRDGNCHDVELPGAVKTRPDLIKSALLGLNEEGAKAYESANLTRSQYFDTVIGIDTAGPEVTCFTGPGMEHFYALAEAVYQAARLRRESGWTGKLLIHTHVGEGMNVYYTRDVPAPKDWSYKTIASRIPAAVASDITMSNSTIDQPAVPRQNISYLLDAISSFEEAHKDWDSYLVFRLAHVTHADADQAAEMARLHVEADVNLDSNVATRAYGLAAMPAQTVANQVIKPLLSDETRNFGLNDLPSLLIPDNDVGDSGRVCDVLGNMPLKSLLQNGVRVLLGTDGGGVEHADIAREYQLAASLIQCWGLGKQGIAIDDLYKNVLWHMQVMGSNEGYKDSY